MKPSVKKGEQRLYHDLAWIWPIMSPPEEYVEEADFFAKAIQRAARGRAKTLLHMGCGGGHLDFTLKKHFMVTGIDLSKEMLKLARKLNPECDYLPGDMRSAKLNEVFDAVTAGDAINYMRTEKELKSAFATACAHLRPGGVFLTIPEYLKDKFAQNTNELATHASGGVEVIYLENWYDPDPADTSFETTFVYLIRRKGKLDVETDRHVVGIFELDLWRKLLKETGFEVREAKFTHSTFPRGYSLPMFVCVKPG